MRRVVVIGTSGSGKSTLARALAVHLGVPHVELDAIHWKTNWIPTSREELIPKVTAALDAAPDGWTVCGHYGQVREVVWTRADTLIWLDYQLGFVMNRLVRRTFRRWWNDEVLWNGNRERLWTQFCTKDSLFLYTCRSFRQRRYHYLRLIKAPRFAHLQIHRFRSFDELECWKRRQGVSLAHSAGTVAGRV